MQSKNIKNKPFFRLAIAVGILFIFLAGDASAATLQINSNTSTLSVGSTAVLYVSLNSEGVAVNNAEAKIIFPNDLIEVASVSRVNSVFSLWVEEPTYSNISGTVNFNGGVPTPGFNGSSGSAISIVFRAKKAGQADITFSDAAVRANDGMGTDVLRTKTGKQLTIIQKEDKPEPEIIAPKISPSAVSLQVTSPTHSSQELWYRNSSPTFSWQLPVGVDAVQTGIDDNKSASPQVTFSPAINERTVKDLEDGIWYFKVRARKSGEWGPVSTYIARIDNTIPKKNEVSFSYDEGNNVLKIKADIIDEMSGVDRYEIYINDILIEKVIASKFVNGNYDFSYKKPGHSVIKLVAVDRAGNMVEASGSFDVIGVSDSGLTLNEKIFLISIVILILVILLVVGAFLLGRNYAKLQNKLKVRPALSKGDNLKVLLVLRRRLEKHLEILQNIRHSRILSKEEEEIKEAIEGDLDEVDQAIEEHKEKE